MPTPRRRSRRRKRNRQKTAPQQRLFDLLTNRGFVGGVWLLAAVVCAAVVLTGPFAATGISGLTDSHADPVLARLLAALLVVAVGSLAGMLWKRWRGTSPADHSGQSEQDAPSGGWARRLATIGAVVMVAGMALLVGDWLSSHQYPPPGELVLPLGEPQESVQIDYGDYQVDVMLPLRTTAHFLDLEGESPRVWLQFANPDRYVANPSYDQLPSLEPSQSLDVEEKRFVFTGLSKAQPQQRAFFTSPGDQTRDDSGVVGEQIQLSVDGPTFRIVDIVDDMLEIYPVMPGMAPGQAQLMLLAQGYPMGAMGPAAQLETDQGETFWVFQRGGELLDTADYVGESIQLEGVQQIPSPVITVSSVRPMWPFALGGVLFVIGWALMLGFPERVRRRQKDGTVLQWSLNQAEKLSAPSKKASSMMSRVTGAAGQIVAVAALAAALLFGATEAGIVAMAGLAAAIGLPRQIDGPARMRATVVAAAIPVAVAIGAIVVMGGIVWSPSADSARLLWTAQIGSWLAMVTALVGAGVLAEESLGEKSTNGAVTAALTIWAAMGAVVAVALQRGAGAEGGLALPVVDAAGDPVVWSIPGVDAVAGIEFPAVVAGTEFAGIAAVVALLAAVAVVGTLVKKPKLSLFGWIGTLVGAVVALVQIHQLDQVELPDAAGYEQLAQRWLDSMNLPGWIAGMGRFDADGEVAVDVAALVPEMMLFVAAGVLAVAMIAVVLMGQFQTASGVADADDDAGALAGRDLFVRAIMFGAMGWFLGLALSWETLGVGGTLAATEWLGLAALFVSLGLLAVGWRRGPSRTEEFVRAYGPALALCVLVWIIGIGAAGGLAPGAAVPLW